MPLTLSKMAANTATVTFPMAGDSLTVEYFPSKITAELLMQFDSLGALTSDASAAIEMLRGFYQQLCDLIKRWDFYEDDAHLAANDPYPLDPEHLMKLDFFFPMQVMGAIVSDARPNLKAPQTTS